MTAPATFWQRPQAARLEQQRRVIVRSGGMRISASWKKEKAA